ncbi:MAG: hypothetical protein methR_P0756 [Methyloprofundus sp.]|nr:MAG: hypothetical protein methR_P0756 [Methyloprofundus sp.]
MIDVNKRLYKVATPVTQYAFRANLFMWPQRTLFFGPLQHLALHSMGAVAINIGLYQPFLLKPEHGDYQSYRCATIPAGCKHELNAFGGIVASLIIEKDAPEYSYFAHCASGRILGVTNKIEAKWVQCLQKIYEDKLDKVAINTLLNQLFNTPKATACKVDARIIEVMQTIQHDPSNDFSQEYLAASVGLSASRFRHLFSEHFDIPYRRYRMWRRVVAAMDALHKVDNLTYAAMDAGFTDSAHFNRCFRNTLGVNPSLVFRNMDRFEV